MRQSRFGHFTSTMGAVAAASALLVAGAGSAGAAVTVSPHKLPAETTQVVKFAVPQGCDGSATTKIAIDFPADVTTVVPTRNVFWEIETTHSKLDEPIVDQQGNQQTERVSRVVYEAIRPLPYDQRDTLEVLIATPATKSGKVLYFPVIQTCKQGHVNWTDIPQGDERSAELKHPAPSVVVGAAAAGRAAGSAATGNHQRGDKSFADDFEADLDEVTAQVKEGSAKVKDQAAAAAGAASRAAKDLSDEVSDTYSDVKSDLADELDEYVADEDRDHDRDGRDDDRYDDRDDDRDRDVHRYQDRDSRDDRDEHRYTDEHVDPITAQARSVDHGGAGVWIPVLLAIIALGAVVLLSRRRR
ncbi:YcnI family protein [Corynebacterium choanae]|uniref:YncI copper-binding domain-containing protein n=1 Tax=Corynebacterium choanae TaxID=1862358 RepID=A0A3G6J9D7_9CORY|nr:YcnI family protein [Corynebacterium choanae]AZA14677.1 hypothetical protein CCHOA_11530 [Corynebacterium choanae]